VAADKQAEREEAQKRASAYARARDRDDERHRREGIEADLRRGQGARSREHGELREAIAAAEQESQEASSAPSARRWRPRCRRRHPPALASAAAVGTAAPITQSRYLTRMSR
jgi:hypothetical protein